MVIIRVMVFNATFNNIPVISWWVSFIDGGNRGTWRKVEFIITCAIIAYHH
jgi:hypothetical protein